MKILKIPKDQTFVIKSRGLDYTSYIYYIRDNIINGFETKNITYLYNVRFSDDEYYVVLVGMSYLFRVYKTKLTNEEKNNFIQ